MRHLIQVIDGRKCRENKKRLTIRTHDLAESFQKVENILLDNILNI